MPAMTSRDLGSMAAPGATIANAVLSFGGRDRAKAIKEADPSVTRWSVHCCRSCQSCRVGTIREVPEAT